MPVLRGALAAAVEPRWALPLCELPAPLRAALGVPRLRRALDDRADVEHGHPDLQQLRRLDARRDMRRRIAPSIMAADFGRLHEQVQSVVDAAPEIVPIDIMEAHLLPTLSRVPPAGAGRGVFGLPLGVLLRIEPDG